jgi:hypothetical protein
LTEENRRRDTKLSARKTSQFMKAQKVQEGVLSDNDSSVINKSLNHASNPALFLDPVEAGNFFS